VDASSSSDAPFTTRTLAEIAATLPGATEIFRRWKLDFCRGGQRSVGEAVAVKGLPLDELEAELRALTAKTPPAPNMRTNEELIGFIETRYHAAHRRELPELVRLARRVEAVHKDHPAAPHGITHLLQRIASELEEHMRQEEEVLFRLIRYGAHASITRTVAAMFAEDDKHRAYLRKLARLTADLTAPEDACPAWRALYASARKFANDLMEHVHTENNVLFPRFSS
jgi:regulator of cell morphogenesis and NO signaling